MKNSEAEWLRLSTFFIYNLEQLSFHNGTGLLDRHSNDFPLKSKMYPCITEIFYLISLKRC